MRTVCRSSCLSDCPSQQLWNKQPWSQRWLIGDLALVPLGLLPWFSSWTFPSQFYYLCDRIWLWELARIYLQPQHMEIFWGCIVSQDALGVDSRSPPCDEGDVRGKAAQNCREHFREWAGWWVMKAKSSSHEINVVPCACKPPVVTYLWGPLGTEHKVTMQENLKLFWY